MKIAVIGVKGIGEAKGGIERHAEELYPRLVKRGHDVSIYCRPHFTASGESYHGVTVKMLRSANTKHLDAISHTLFSSIHALFKNYDIIHYHAIGPALLSFIPKLKPTGRVCVTIHALDWEREKWRGFAKFALKLGERAAARFSDKLIVVSKELEKYCKQKYPFADVACIPNGVNLPTLVDPNGISARFGLEKRRYLLFAGRLVPEKACHSLIRAFKLLKTDTKLVIAGEASHSKGYARRLKELAKDDSRIIFTGHLSGNSLAEAYTNAYGYVLPSDLEGLPVALLEALSYGLPTLCSDIPPHLEVAKGNGNGSYSLFFKHGDESDLYRKLQVLLSQHDELSKKAETAKREIIQTYNWDTITASTEKVYQSLMDNNGGAT